MNEINVRKWGGQTEPYDREKIRAILDKYGLSDDVVNQVLDEVEENLYDGITTKEIFSLIEEKIGTRPRILKRDLRSALGEMSSKPDFEVFVQQLLGKMGYHVTDERVIKGHCVEHEIDGVAEKDGKLYYIETKHHSKTHIKTPFIHTLAAKSKLDDIRQGFLEGKNNFDFERVILLCNTKLTSHANRYAKCVGIQHIGWKTPDGGMEQLIRKTRNYPVTILGSTSRSEKRRLSEANVVTLDDLLDVKKVSKISSRRIKELKTEARKIIS
jgi:hypothetical protein